MATTIVSNGTPLNVNIREMSLWKMVLVRTIRSFLQTLLGLLTANTIGAIPFEQAKTMFFIAASAALVSFIQNSIEILSRLDTNDKYVSYRA